MSMPEALIANNRTDTLFPTKSVVHTHRHFRKSP